MFSGSAEGGVSVWENRCSERDPLRLLHHWSGQVTGCGGGGPDGRLALSPRGERLFVAHGRAWLKILEWRSGEAWSEPNTDTVSLCVCVCVLGLCN